MTEYKSRRIVGWVIVNENGEITNRNPSKDELRKLKIFPEKDGRSRSRSQAKDTNKQLLCYPIQYYEENGRPPTVDDFRHNFKYPCPNFCIKRFESWSNYLKLVELDVESMVKKGIVETNDQKARLSEIIIRDHFKNNSVDLAGENKNSPCDGICPNKKIYDVKSSKLRKTFYNFNTRNKYRENIEIYYLLGFNGDYTKLEYGWRIPGEIVEKDYFIVGYNSRAEFNIINMEEYDITEELRDILRKYGFLNKEE